MKNTTVYIVRHGQTNANVTRTIQGQLVDEPLNAAGLRQAEAVADRFEGVHLDMLFSSPLPRARQTARAIRQRNPEVDYRELSGLMEMRWGIPEGQSFGDVNKDLFDRLEMDWAAGWFDESVEGGESIRDVQQRAISSFDEIIQAGRGKTVAVITHGRLIRVLLSSKLPGVSDRRYPPNALTRMDELMHDNTAVSRIEVSDDAIVPLYLRDVSHLHKKSPSQVMRFV